MPQSTKVIKNRIKSVKNTKKITKAMEMISAVKMRKAVDVAIRMKPYAQLANDFLQNLSDVKLNHPLLNTRETKTELLILITSNRGLCGSYNSNILKLADKIIKNTDHKIKIIAFGKKSANFAKYKNIDLYSFYDQFSENVSFEDTLSISKEIIDLYIEANFDKVGVIYTNYVSGLSQKAEYKQILPVTIKEMKNIVSSILDTNQTVDEQFNSDLTTERFSEDEYIFEPNKTEVLNFVIPLLIEIALYHSVLESVASEHSSRMIAMKNASESANEMIDELNLVFNKSRQAQITQEIAEITAGANAI